MLAASLWLVACGADLDVPNAVLVERDAGSAGDGGRRQGGGADDGNGKGDGEGAAAVADGVVLKFTSRSVRDVVGDPDRDRFYATLGPLADRDANSVFAVGLNGAEWTERMERQISEVEVAADGSVLYVEMSADDQGQGNMVVKLDSNGAEVDRFAIGGGLTLYDMAVLPDDPDAIVVACLWPSPLIGYGLVLHEIDGLRWPVAPHWMVDEAPINPVLVSVGPNDRMYVIESTNRFSVIDMRSDGFYHIDSLSFDFVPSAKVVARGSHAFVSTGFVIDVDNMQLAGTVPSPHVPSRDGSTIFYVSRDEAAGHHMFGTCDTATLTCEHEREVFTSDANAEDMIRFGERGLAVRTDQGVFYWLEPTLR